MLKLKNDWEYNVLGVYNYKKAGQYQAIFDFVREYHDKIEGDIVEAGVFRGGSLIAMGMLLKELGSNKVVYGYDSFAGFPPVYDANDDFEAFEELYKTGGITEEHWEDVKKNKLWRELISGRRVDVSTISSSGDFSGTNMEYVKRKINLIGLDNIVLVDGPFSQTMNHETSSPKAIMSVLIDCDLYASYKQTLSFVWPKLAKNGLVYLDEYYSLKFPGARIAINEFLKVHQADLKMMQKHQGDFERWYLVK